MNLDLYNFHTRATLLQTSPSSDVLSSSSMMLASSSNICQSWNDGTCRWPFGQCRYGCCCEKCEGKHPVSTVPFRPHSLIVSTRGQLPCHGVNASGIIVVARSFQPTLRKNFVHNVDIPGSVQFSNVVLIRFPFRLMLLRRHKISVASFLLRQLKLPVLISPPS